MFEMPEVWIFILCAVWAIVAFLVIAVHLGKKADKDRVWAILQEEKERARSDVEEFRIEISPYCCQDIICPLCEKAMTVIEDGERGFDMWCICGVKSGWVSHLNDLEEAIKKSALEVIEKW